MAVLVDVVGGGQFLANDTERLEDIHNAYRKFDNAYTIQGNFANTFSELDDTSFDDLIESLAKQSSTPFGPSYSEQAGLLLNKDKGKDTDSIYSTPNTTLVTNPDGTVSEVSRDNRPGNLIRTADSLKTFGNVVGGGLPGILKEVGGRLKNELQTTDAAIEQKDLADAIDSTYTKDRALETIEADYGSTFADKDKYSGVVGSLVKGALGVLTANPLSLTSTGLEYAAGRAVNEAFEKNRDDFNEKVSEQTREQNADKVSDESGTRGSTTYRGRNNVPVEEQSFNAPAASRYKPSYSNGNRNSDLFSGNTEVTKGSFNSSPIGNVSFDNVGGRDSGNDDDNSGGGNDPSTNSGASRGAGNSGR